ncbi:MAG: MFS transporter, partial [Gilvibacter sp.]|nr:MFS transporter [Gilvibacter sp.]
SITGLKILFGYWGFTTIFLFWAAMIKATRVWGGNQSQGRAFGILDGGRGLVGALFASMGIWILAAFSSADITEISPAERQAVFSYVIYTTTVIVSVIGVLVWFFMKSDTEGETTLSKISWQDIWTVL